MKRFISVIALALVSAMVVHAQNTSGILLNRDIVTASSLLTHSQSNVAGTARSMGMGGAFTSLGADMASFGYNPAGFGMYQRNDLSVTLGLGASTAKNYNAYSSAPSSNNDVRFSINNVGGSFLVYEGSGAVTAVNLAFGYNKTADYNFDMSYSSVPTVSSLADAFSDIANAGRLVINSNNKITDPNGYYDYDMNPYYWGTAMAYKAGLINQGANGWYPDEIGYDATMTQYTNLRSRGSAGEFSFALGMNISNVVYLGASLDIHSISRKQTIFYEEYIDYPEGQRPNPYDYPYQLQYFKLGESVSESGTGVGAKFGIVIRPVEGLRFGFAIHTPTYYTLAYRYNASLSSSALSAGSNPNGWDVENGYVYADEATPTLQDGGDHRWVFTTPTRLLAGISYSIGEYAVLSADYQYDAYRGIKLKYAPIADAGYNSITFHNNLNGVHSLRAGIEAKLAPWFALRLGGGYRSRLFTNGYDMVAFSEPVADTSWHASAGLGFRLGKVTSIDLAYQYNNIRYSDYYSYYTQVGDVPNHSPLYGLDVIKHNVAVTFAFRF